MALSLEGLRSPEHFAAYNASLPQRHEAVHQNDQAAAFDKALHTHTSTQATHSTEHASNSHGGHCCCCCCGGGKSTNNNDTWEATEELTHAAKKLTHALKEARKEEEYWDAFNKSVYDSIFQRGNRIVQNAKKEGERILDEYYLNPPKSNKKHS